MADLTDAILLAAEAHRGQTSKDGEPYVLHAIRVMLGCSTESEMIVGVLHDVVEDTDVQLHKIAERGFPDDVVAAVDSMTKREDEDYDSYLSRVEANPIARAVKLADLADNMNLDRIPELRQKDFDRMLRYREARQRLRASDRS